jgi:pimeloyl-ACP methyl ester carboxylesterase
LSKKMRRIRISILATVAPLLLVVAAPSSSAALPFSPCAKVGGFSCASLSVPLERSGAMPGSVSLSIERRLAGAAASRVAVLALAGGPGQAALPLGSYVAEAIAPAVGARDLLLFDQRGTGASGALACPALTSASELSRAKSAEELVEHCALQLGPARGAYTTRESVEDIEAVRQAAGYEKLVLYGTSYGTKVALEYAERYPQRVESLLLDSTETPEGPDPFQVSTFKAMGPMLGELCSRLACRRVSSNPVGELARLAAQLAAHPLTGHVFDGRGKPVRISIAGGDLFALVKAGDLNPAIRPQLPAAVHAAVHHDPAPLLRLIALVGLQRAGAEGSDLNFTLLLDTSCEETPFPWQRAAAAPTRAVEAEAALNALPGSDFYPFDPESGLFAGTIPLCVAWPDASAPPPPIGPLPDLPALILSGGQDLRTPTENARRVAALIPDAQVLHVPYTGHSVIGSDLSGCARTALTSFFAGAAVRPCSPAANRFRVAPLAPGRLAGVAPTPGVGGPAGRTLAGVLDSLLDLRRAVLTAGFDFGGVPYGARFGGLRGGGATGTKAGVQLNRFSYIPGLQVTGLVPIGIVLRNSGSPARLRIGGPAAAAGQVRVGASGRLSGVLAGRSFHVRAAAKVRSASASAGGEVGEPAEADFPASPLARLP